MQELAETPMITLLGVVPVEGPWDINREHWEKSTIKSKSVDMTTK